MDRVLCPTLHHRAAAWLAVEPIWLHKDPRPEWWRMRHVLYASQHVSRGAVEEWDDLSAARVYDDFCTPTAGYEARMVAGLSKRL
jgi:hypothetical protein